MRLACITVPLFPLAARLRSEPDLKGEAVVIVEGNGNAARVVAASRRAREKGVRAGMTLPQARALLPGLTARGRDRESERAAQEALLEVADGFSPRVEDAGEGVVYIDLVGTPGLAVAPAYSGPADAPASGSAGCGLDRTPGPSRAPAPAARGSSPLGDSSRCDQGTEGSGDRIPDPVRAVGAGLAPAPPPLPMGEGRGEGKTSAEVRLGRDILSAVEKAGLPARIGLAASKLAARVAANLPDSPSVVPDGEEAEFLAPLPLERLAPEIEIAEILERWGIRSIGELARLPEGEVASRLGELGRELHATARGIDPRPLAPRVPPLVLTEGMDLEWPLATLEPFLFLGHAALERLVARLEAQALACTRLEIVLKLDPDGCDARAIRLPAPTRDAKTLLTLVRLELEAHPPGAPVAGFAFTAEPDQPRRAQLALFGPAALSPDRLATTIARLAALLGADRVGSPQAVDGHRPERFALARYAPPPPPDLAHPPKAGRGLLAVRVLRPPLPLDVIVEESGDRAIQPSSDREIPNPQSPVTKLSSLRLLSLKTAPDATPAISGSVKVSSGPWSMEEGWWLDGSGRGASSLPEGRRLAPREPKRSEGIRFAVEALRPSCEPLAQPDPEQAKATVPAARDYWDVELSDGGLYRIYRDRKDGAWFADGIYD